LTTTGEENVASKLWPSLLILDPTACTSLTRRVVPAGMTTGAGGGGDVGSTGGAGVAASVGGAWGSGEAGVLGGGVVAEDVAAEDGPAEDAAGADEFDEV
jgi:hypothetical protein